MDWKVRALTLVLWLGLVLAFVQNGNAEKRVVCYYTNWSVYRPGTAKFSPQNINPYLCTHLIYAFGGFTKDNTLKPFDKYQDIEKGGYAKFTGLKTYNKNLKTLLAIGGWNEGSSRFSPMVADAQRRKEFVKNCVKFLRQNHFDGLDLDWEYPAFRDGGKPRDKENYAILVEELREQFERESLKTGRPRLLLTMAMPAGIEYIDKGYDVPRLNDNLDFINLLSYDYHSAFEPAVNHHSPLYPLEEDNEYNYDTELTIEFTINHLIKQGASSEKIVLGIPTYGRSYTLFNQDSTDIGSPADGPGTEGDATREKGYLAYYEICENVGKDEWEVVQPNPEAMGPYAFKENQWVGYDDENIVRVKAQYVNEKKLGGIMFWSIDNDDFRGKCHGRPYPLIEAAKEALFAAGSKREEIKEKSTLRKSTRTQSSQSNSSGRQYSSSNRRTSTTDPPTRKRINSLKSKSRSSTRASQIDENDEDILEDEEDDRNFVRVSEKPTRSRINKNRSRIRSSESGGRRKQKNRDSKPAENSKIEESLSNKLTTPEPPTTPDPGSDFKCEDEGFFPHPRDCKKYFWCLDSGPSGLGVVAHQFTCPSGLVFNKGADSCDYPRNVVCPKVKSASEVTTTKAPTTSRPTTRRTTTQKPEPEEEYEYEDEEEEEEEVPTTTAKPLLYKTISRSRPSSTTASSTRPTTPATIIQKEEENPVKSLDIAEEEDPRVIKELIDLIKKAGGIEQLEKQLLLQEKPVGGQSGTTIGSGQVTPATISRSLYERVLNRQASKVNSRFFGTSSKPPENKAKEESEGNKRPRIGYTNGPGRAQFDGLDDLPEVKSLRRTNKPQYTTIERSRSSPSERIDENEDDEDKNDNADVASSEERSISNPPEEKILLPRVTPSYVNIRRNRPVAARDNNDVNVKEDEVEDKLSPRRRFPVLSTRTEKSVSDNKDPKTQRNSTNDGYDEFQSPTETEKSAKRTVFPNKKDDESAKSRYISIQRFRSTTERQEKVNNEFQEIPLNSDVTQTNLNTFKDTTPTPGSSAFPYTVSMTYSQSSSSSQSTSPLTTISTTTTTTTENPTTQPITIHDEPIFSTKTPPSSLINSNVKLVEETATEILLATSPSTSPPTPIETTTKEILAAVSQPRPFGFTRGRSRATSSFLDSTTPLPSATLPSRSKMASSESFQLPTLKQLIAHQNHSTGNGEKSQLSLPPLPLISSHGLFKQKEEIVDVPIQILDDQDPNNLLVLRVPQKNLNKTILHTVLKIKVIDPKIFKYGSGLEDGTGDMNLLTNELLIKEVKALREREFLESEKQTEINELEKSAATYRRPRIDSTFGQSSVVQMMPESVSRMVINGNPEESLPRADVERNRRRRVRPHSQVEQVTHNSRRRPSRRRKVQVADTSTIAITTSRSPLPDPTTTDYPRGFLLTRSTDETLTPVDDFVGPQSTEPSNRANPRRTSSSADHVSSNIGKVPFNPSFNNVKWSSGFGTGSSIDETMFSLDGASSADEKSPGEEFLYEKSADGKSAESKSTEKLVDEEYYNEKFVDEKFVDEKSVNGKSTDGKSGKDKFNDEKYVDETFADEKSANEKYVNEKSADEKSANEKYIDEKFSNEKYVDEKFANEKSVNEESVNEESANEKFVSEKYVNGKSNDESFSVDDSIFVDGEFNDGISSNGKISSKTFSNDKVFSNDETSSTDEISPIAETFSDDSVAYDKISSNHETPSLYKTPNFETSDDETSSLYKTSNDKAPNFETSDDETPNDETFNDQTSTDQTFNDQTSKDQTSKDPIFNRQRFNHQRFNHQTFNHQTFNHQTFNDETSNDKTSNDETFYDETFNDTTSNDETFNDETIFPNLETSNNETIFSYEENEEAPSTTQEIFSNIEREIPSATEETFSNIEREMPSTTEEIFSNLEDNFSSVEKMTRVTFNTDESYNATETNSDVTDFERTSLPEDGDQFSYLTSTDSSRDYFNYNKHEEDVNFSVTSKSPQGTEYSDSVKSTTEEIGVTFEDAKNFTPTIVEVTSPRRHLRKKIRKIKPVSKIDDHLESPPIEFKGIRSKKVNEKFSVKNAEFSGKSDLVKLDSSAKAAPSLKSDSLNLNSEFVGKSEFISTNPEFSSVNLDSFDEKIDSKKIDSTAAIASGDKNYKSVENPEDSIPDSTIFPFTTEFPIFYSKSTGIDSTSESLFPGITDKIPNLKSEIFEKDNNPIETNLNKFSITKEIVLDSNDNQNQENFYKKFATNEKNDKMREDNETMDISNQFLNTETKFRQNSTSSIESNSTDSIIDKQLLNTKKSTNSTNTKKTTDSKQTSNGRRRVLKRKRIGQKIEERVNTEGSETNENKSKELEKVKANDKSKEIRSENKSISVNPQVKPTRKRVLVYRGAKRFSSMTTPSTTTVQSFPDTEDHHNENTTRRRMRTVVRKRPKSEISIQSNRKGKKLSLSEEMKMVEDAEEAGSEVNSYRTSSDTSRRGGSFYREPNRNRIRTTTRQSVSSIHPTLRRFINPARQTLHFQETTIPSQISFASTDDAAALLEHLARLEDQKAEMDDQANRAHEIDLENFETTTESGDSSIGTTFWRKISTTELPKTLATSAIPALRRRQGQKYFNKIVTQNLTQRPRRPAIIDYDYYEDEEIRFVGKPRLNGKLYVTSRGNINCLDQGNFPHPTSCKKFITCARMVNGLVVGTEYTCPDKLSFDPIGGICNWSAGLGCKE